MHGVGRGGEGSHAAKNGNRSSSLSLTHTHTCTGVATFFSGVMKAGAVRVLFEIDEVGPLDAGGPLKVPDTCFERSHYTFYDKDDKITDHGK